MAIIINKLGEHRNEDALLNLLSYMTSSPFYTRGNCRGCMSNSIRDIIIAFEFTKEMYKKTDRKQVSHMIIGTENDEVTAEGLIVIAEATLAYFYNQGFQCFYVIHSGSNEKFDYWHIHIAINTINFMNGKRLYETYAVTSTSNNK